MKNYVRKRARSSEYFFSMDEFKKGKGLIGKIGEYNLMRFGIRSLHVPKVLGAAYKHMNKFMEAFLRLMGSKICQISLEMS